MKRIAQIAGLALLGLSIGFCFGQSTSTKAAASVLPSAPAPQNFYAAGPSWNQTASPQIAGSALYAHAVDTSGTYAFGVVDALPQGTSPFTVTSNIGVGIAQQVTSFTVGKNVWRVFMPTAAGISWTGSNTGWQWSGGGLLAIPVKSWYVMPNVRFLKSSVSGGSGYQPIIGLMVGKFF